MTNSHSNNIERIMYIKERIKASVTIEQVIEKLTGAKLSKGKMLCPFHSEKTMSFMIDSQKQVYYCFGCGAGGDIFNFVMEFYKVSFQQAVHILNNEFQIDAFRKRVSAAEQNLIRRKKIEERKRLEKEKEKEEREDKLLTCYRTAHDKVLELEPMSELWCYYMNKLIYYEYLLEEV